MTLDEIKYQPTYQLKWLQTTLILCLLLLLLYDFISFPQTVTHVWHDQSQAYLSEALADSASAFLIARGINAGISVLQSVTITPVLAAISIGEILDPINDLIERFSWIMLLVSIALGIQQLLLEMTDAWDIQQLLYIILSLGFLLIWWQRSRHFLFRLIFLLLLIRFSMPLMLMSVDQLDQHFLKKSTQETIALLSIEQQRLEKNLDENWLSAAKEKLNQLKQQSDKVLAQFIHLATLFVLKTLVLPILVWMLIWFFFKQWLYPIPVNGVITRDVSYFRNASC